MFLAVLSDPRTVLNLGCTIIMQDFTLLPNLGVASWSEWRILRLVCIISPKGLHCMNRLDSCPQDVQRVNIFGDPCNHTHCKRWKTVTGKRQKGRLRAKMNGGHRAVEMRLKGLTANWHPGYPTGDSMELVHAVQCLGMGGQAMHTEESTGYISCAISGSPFQERNQHGYINTPCCLRVSIRLEKSNPYGCRTPPHRGLH